MDKNKLLALVVFILTVSFICMRSLNAGGFGQVGSKVSPPASPAVSSVSPSPEMSPSPLAKEVRNILKALSDSRNDLKANNVSSAEYYRYSDDAATTASVDGINKPTANAANSAWNSPVGGVFQARTGNHPRYGYRSSDILKSFERSRKTVLDSLSQKAELDGMVTYARERFPQPELKMLGTDNEGNPLISGELKDTAYAEVETFIAYLSAMIASGPVNLRIYSNPNPAKFEMWTDIGKVRETTTNNSMPDVYRGWYHYRLTRVGFKTIEGQLDLIDDTGTSVECQMIAETASEGPFPCKLMP